eukprot:CAMPEP_0171712238 /NCGR_PEP_ID=MMETSP0991-20121206/17062_1 /TAXON_ID=483369 /ORGANISM="non described non described, Strain CCMP2098" /LENGTH=61 /DNA_ID=CAMNT_0012302713 /DNA_START=1774 /DNA_END=1959 /DNA_ORIENTATION=+
MPELFDDSPGTIFASAAGLIVYFGRVPSIPVAWAISEQGNLLTAEAMIRSAISQGELNQSS